MMSLVGQSLSHYDILEELGTGGMGVVYKARDATLLRQVAIKTLASGYDDEKQKQRFIQEARAASALNHPSIVGIYDFGRDKDVDFIVMEYVKGKSLAQELSLGALPVRTAVDYAVQVAGAMEMAHNAGIVHRDLKPHNIMVTKDGGIKILDFGIAKLNPAADAEGEGGEVQTALTGHGHIIGTLAYMSPEQAVGEKVDPRSDIFSLGIVLYEMISGVPPFEGDGEQSLLRKLHFDTPTSLCALQDDIPEALNKIVQTTLSKHPDHRQQSMKYLKGQLESLSIDAPGPRITQSDIKTREVTNPELPMEAVESSNERRDATLSKVFMKLAEKPKRSLLGVLAVILGLGIVTAFALIGVFTADPQNKLADSDNILTVLPVETVGDDKELSIQASAITKSLIAGLSQPNSFKTPLNIVSTSKRPTSGLLIASSLQQKDDTISMELNLIKDGIQVASATCIGTQDDLESLERQALLKSVGLLRHQQESKADPAASPKEKDARELVKQGQALLDAYVKRPDKKENIDKAIESFQLAISKDSNNALANAGLSRAYLRKYESNEDPMWLSKSEGTARRAVELNPDLSASRVSLGFVLLHEGKKDEAEQELTQALTLDPFHANAHRGLAGVWQSRGDLQKALACCKDALNLNSENRELFDLLGHLHRQLGNYIEAEAAFLRSVEVAPDSVVGHRNLGAIYVWQGKYSSAATHLQRALEISPDAPTYSNLGLMYFYQGRYSDAVLVFEKAIEMPGGANDYMSWVDLGDAYRWTPENQSKANNAYTVAIKLGRDLLKEDHGNLMVNSVVALCLAKKGNRSEALESIKSILDKQIQNPQIQYIVVVVFELAGKRSAALEWLEKAILAGYSLEDVRQDPELEKLRQDPSFHKMMARTEQKKGSSPN